MIRRSIIVDLIAAIFLSSCDTRSRLRRIISRRPFRRRIPAPHRTRRRWQRRPQAPPKTRSRPLHRLSPTEVPGTGAFLNSGNQRPVTEVTPGPQGAISFNFVNADVRDVLREILGEHLYLPYTIDSKVQTTITAQTGAPLQPDAVLPILSDILETNGLGLVKNND